MFRFLVSTNCWFIKCNSEQITLKRKGKLGKELTINKDVFKTITVDTEKVKQEMYASGCALVIMKDNNIIHT
jgi:hypothetical protein